jgi:hypothetical protein
VDAGHLVTGGTGVGGIAKMKPSQAANAASEQKNGGEKHGGANEFESAGDGHQNLLPFQPVLM